MPPVGEMGIKHRQAVLAVSCLGLILVEQAGRGVDRLILFHRLRSAD